jgi:hypothetical protein
MRSIAIAAALAAGRHRVVGAGEQRVEPAAQSLRSDHRRIPCAFWWRDMR